MGAQRGWREVRPFRTHCPLLRIHVLKREGPPEEPTGAGVVALMCGGGLGEQWVGVAERGSLWLKCLRRPLQKSVQN